ncbi:hypothetical protein G6F42_022492 [Rhizopus arrhizus]|nr:hypothetical protein G6F42_022492 [Rhizopus arrhizus]
MHLFMASEYSLGIEYEDDATSNIDPFASIRSIPPSWGNYNVEKYNGFGLLKRKSNNEMWSGLPLSLGVARACTSTSVTTARTITKTTSITARTTKAATFTTIRFTGETI